MIYRSDEDERSEDIERQATLRQNRLPDRLPTIERVSALSYFSEENPKCIRVLICLCNFIVTIFLFFIIIFSVCNDR